MITELGGSVALGCSSDGFDCDGPNATVDSGSSTNCVDVGAADGGSGEAGVATVDCWLLVGETASDVPSEVGITVVGGGTREVGSATEDGDGAAEGDSVGSS